MHCQCAYRLCLNDGHFVCHVRQGKLHHIIDTNILSFLLILACVYVDGCMWCRLICVMVIFFYCYDNGSASDLRRRLGGSWVNIWFPIKTFCFNSRHTKNKWDPQNLVYKGIFRINNKNCWAISLFSFIFVCLFEENIYLW